MSDFGIGFFRIGEGRGFEIDVDLPVAIIECTESVAPGVANRNTRSAERKQLQRRRWFKQGQRWRTGCEGRISVLKRRHGPNCCRWRTGVTAFRDICQMAEAFHCAVMPHASIGIGIFQAASLHCAAIVKNLPYHEYQHSIFDRNLRFITGDMSCREGFFAVPSGPGLGVEPRPEVSQFVQEASEELVHAAR